VDTSFDDITLPSRILEEARFAQSYLLHRSMRDRIPRELIDNPFFLNITPMLVQAELFEYRYSSYCFILSSTLLNYHHQERSSCSSLVLVSYKVYPFKSSVSFVHESVTVTPFC